MMNKELEWLPLLIKLHDEGCTSIAVCFEGIILKNIFFTNDLSGRFSNGFNFELPDDIKPYVEIEARKIMHPYLGENKKSWESVVIINVSRGIWDFMFMYSEGRWSGKLEI